MSRIDIIRAWKDEAYRQSLSEAERASLPQNPAGSVELTETEADAVGGGWAAITCGCGCHSQGLVMNKFNKVINVSAARFRL